ncbi:MAG: hypothetical protein M1375_05240 [Candidatus Thermoplasmatota archaeon]|jgi:hypothetical protein|nr:hypothetical protein [Candidatus Thermoplasmatota archaeon]MCL5791357.1 hypothetical protein [Candidatus Thermoplasmatota archaeon]
MRLEIGDSVTLEFDRNMFDDEVKRMPVNIYSTDFQRIEIIELNSTMRKNLQKIVDKTVEPTVFVNIKRTSKLRYEVSPGTAIISRDKKSLFI